MLSVIRPGSNDPFPAVEEALSEPNGLLAAGGDLSVKRLLAAYRSGIFPWFEEGQPILWWSPDPRLIIEPDQAHTSRRLARTLRNSGFHYTVNRAFPEVIRECAAARANQEGTWITPQMQQAYEALHQRGYAHSLEVWQSDALVGGIYGVSIGKVFFGESMFHHVTDASKAALLRLCSLMQSCGIELLDCQVASAHLFTMGAKQIPREEFIARIDLLCLIPPDSPPFTPRALES